MAYARKPALPWPALPHVPPDRAQPPLWRHPEGRLQDRVCGADEGARGRGHIQLWQAPSADGWVRRPANHRPWAHRGCRLIGVCLQLTPTTHFLPSSALPLCCKCAPSLQVRSLYASALPRCKCAPSLQLRSLSASALPLCKCASAVAWALLLSIGREEVPPASLSAATLGRGHGSAAASIPASIPCPLLEEKTSSHTWKQ